MLSNCFSLFQSYKTNVNFISSFLTIKKFCKQYIDESGKPKIDSWDITAQKNNLNNFHTSLNNASDRANHFTQL